MKAPQFFISNLAGFSLRFSILAYIGYASIDVFAPSFDMRFRALLYLIAALCALYILLYSFFIRKRKGR